MITTAILAVVCIYVLSLNRKTMDNYNDALDKLDALSEYSAPVSKTRFRAINTSGYQNSLLNGLLFTLLLDLLNESDEGVAVNRLIELRDLATTMNESSSEYVRKSNNAVNRDHKKSMDAIMCWLCSVFDVRNGKNELSAGAYLAYNTFKNHIIKEQQTLIKIYADLTKEEQKHEEVNEESFEEDYEDDYQEQDQEEFEEQTDSWDEEDDYEDEYEEEVKPGFFNGVKLLFKGYQE
mgnify:CR=1 FL=1